MAAEKGHAECVSLLLEAGADVNNDSIFSEVGYLYYCWLVWIIGGANVILEREIFIPTDFVTFLLSLSLFSFKEFWMPLMTAANNGHDKCIPLLLKAGADVHHTDTVSASAAVSGWLVGWLVGWFS